MQSPQRLRDALVVALTVVTGTTDAIAFTRLGGVFTSVMTGNIVLLGLGVGSHDLGIFLHTGLAVVAFVLGALAGVHVAGTPADDDPVWPRRLTAALVAELVLFVGVGIGWWACGSHPGGGARDAMLAASAVALGLQSGAILRLGVSGLSTTYLTGTLTTLVQRVWTTRRLRGSGRSLCILLALAGGAALGTALVTQCAVAAPLPSIVLVAAVIVLAELRFGADDAAPTPGGAGPGGASPGR